MNRRTAAGAGRDRERLGHPDVYILRDPVKLDELANPNQV